MGTIIHLEAVRSLCKRSPVVSLSSIRKIIGEKSKYVHLLLHNMVKKKELHRVTRGMYSIHDDPTIAVHCFMPAYLGLQEALSIHNLWEQETNVVILTSKIVREGVRSIFGNNVMLRRLPPPYLFGIEYIQYGDFYLPVSDIEKTLIDMAYFKQPLDKGTIKEFKKRIDSKKLQEYLAHYDEKTRTAVGQLLDRRKRIVVKAR